MNKDFNFNIQSLRVIGGGSANDQWLQILADVTKNTIVKTNQPRHAGAIGGAMCAMVGSKTYDDFNSIHQLIKPTNKYSPNKDNFAIYDELFELYKSVYKSLKTTYSQANKTRFSKTFN